jgi:hypothetical protein
MRSGLEIDGLNRSLLTLSGLFGTDFAAMQQAALIPNQEAKQATESFTITCIIGGTGLRLPAELSIIAKRDT